MKPFDWLPRAKQMQAMRSEVDNLKATVREQALVINDVTSATNLDTKYKGNSYGRYEDAVEELASKYEGTADWGVLQTGNIIDLRSAFIAGAGLSVYPKDKEKNSAEKEMEFVKAFLEANSLEREMLQEFAKEAEIEGRFLAELRWDEEKKQVIVRFVSWSDYGYTVKSKDGDYAKFEQVTWSKDGKQGKLDAPFFVYARFGGRINSADKPYPKVGKCLTQIDDLDKALRDWREICRLFAAPVPHIECATADEAAKMQAAVEKLNYKVKKFLCHTGKFDYASPSMEGATSLMEEIITLAKMISGTTGVPVQFLGLPDIASIRASESTNTAELITAATQKERLIWKGVYQEIISKAMAIWNDESSKTALDPTLVTVDIPYITADHWGRIRDIWLPLYTASAISQKTLLGQVPGVDVQAELVAKEERTAALIEDMSRDSDDDDDEGGDDDETGKQKVNPFGKGNQKRK